MYIVCGVVMTGYVPTYANITQDELNSIASIIKILFVLLCTRKDSILLWELLKLSYRCLYCFCWAV